MTSNTEVLDEIEHSVLHPLNEQIAQLNSILADFDSHMHDYGDHVFDVSLDQPDLWQLRNDIQQNIFEMMSEKGRILGVVYEE
jgi:hypothetical protein